MRALAESQTLDLAALRAAARALAGEEANAILRHALRNKLAAIRNANYYVKRRVGGSEVVKQDPRVAEFIEMIDREVRAACDTIEATRRAPPPPRAAVDAACVARRLAGAVDARVSVEAPESARAQIDERDLAVALLLLVDNALEAGATAARVAIARGADGAVVVSVSDDGPGFTKEARERAFSQHTTKEGHDGLGLAIAKRLAANANGRASVEDAERGARVVLSIPAAVDHAG